MSLQVHANPFAVPHITYLGPKLQPAVNAGRQVPGPVHIQPELQAGGRFVERMTTVLTPDGPRVDLIT